MLQPSFVLCQMENNFAFKCYTAWNGSYCWNGNAFCQFTRLLPFSFLPLRVHFVLFIMLAAELCEDWNLVHLSSGRVEKFFGKPGPGPMRDHISRQTRWTAGVAVHLLLHIKGTSAREPSAWSLHTAVVKIYRLRASSCVSGLFATIIQH